MNYTIAEKLSLLLKLQTIDSELATIAEFKGVLPKEIVNLEAAILALEEKLQVLQKEIAALEKAIEDYDALWLF